jgi:hypothetical protein
VGFRLLDSKLLFRILWRRTNRDAQTLRSVTTNQTRKVGLKAEVSTHKF